ncbi:hypothetical protein TSUD_330350 [Trifolium subterraneum]|nr:hypothetical protein TSUD_330350 [Trifolium subterraneum]
MGLAAESQFHVLAVDDSIIDRKLIERLLKTSSYQVTTVDSGSKALEFLGLCENDETNPNTPSVFPNNHQESSSLRNIPVVIICLEEGAEEFFLKPVRLSDLSRLKPHMKKTKLKDQKQETEQIFENSEILQNDPKQAPKTQLQHSESESQSQTQLQAHSNIDQQQQSLQQGNNNKRKNMEQGLSSETDRTRPRYSGIATVV